jgi:hypothetical protein
LIGSWPSPFTGLRGKKLPVAFYQLRIDPLPLTCQEVPHHLVAGGKRLGLEMIKGRLLLKETSVGCGDLDLVQLGHALGGPVVIDALDHNAKAAHGTPPEPINGRRYLMIRRPGGCPLLPTHQAQRFCALTKFEEVVVGRELKMIALEKELEKLQREVEKRPTRACATRWRRWSCACGKARSAGVLCSTSWAT